MNEGATFEARLAGLQRNPVYRTWRTIRGWPIVPVTILTVMATFAIFAPLLAPKDPIKQSLRHQYVPPIWATEERLAKDSNITSTGVHTGL